MSKTAPASVTPLFVTELYRADLGDAKFEDFLAELDDTCRAIADEDESGQPGRRPRAISATPPMPR
ncbi:hypothetical protein MMA231_01584 [Asticcacaulis sp. MM231]